MLTDRLITRIGSLRGLSPLRMGSFGSVSSAPPGSAKIVPAFQKFKKLYFYQNLHQESCLEKYKTLKIMNQT
ncbi:hypothetical protein B9Z55_016672 [Caenorhabditis nigoni]|uniref:Uncharacterized protein n=1 Tax=Caenorhabditis nigoni TaxID=1611254 RepID=A0A2G5T6B3_9PELO|nr:hypothetical protein B9Z55_016672 [Caenorhabditis nigoni]